ncbi:carboxypeptidase-like regulatory domain-containing protein [Thermococcus sp. Bubb.Bath]|uniref:carboxypeptidase-like regulatory domain-containing protein n=1 Tax=Thermococcus sp. Bubb.Bath TaxID=1638242 RepID=UPI001439D154|nr:carboxypeptidase-like regulatory domain-containing protein [Thermococcus sp. Bubb.Bath]NJF24910.1 carboxypeptidase regulatory-like domain-containing protein [Thermococcus sp. Bubb.Bath]
MDRRRVSLLVFLLSALMVLSLSYAMIPSGGLVHLKSPPKSEAHKAPSRLRHSESPPLTKGDIPISSRFVFKEVNFSISCPVAILPNNPMLVCTDAPAKGVPLPNDLSWKMYVRYRGTYYIPIRGEGIPSGVNGEGYLKVDRPLITVPVGGNFSLSLTPLYSGNVTLRSSKYFHIINVSKLPFNVTLAFHVSENAPPGYYPLFFSLRWDNRVNVLLMWVHVLPRAVVRITSMPSLLKGNGELEMKVSGTVEYSNGTPIRNGTVTVTVNRTKREKGVIVGTGKVENGKFNVKCQIPSGVPAGSYEVVAHYTGKDIYPGNSDPELIIKRLPEIDANLTSSPTGTVIRGFVHYRELPINGSVTLRLDTENGTLTIPLNLSDGRFTLKINQTLRSADISYPGDKFYLPSDKKIRVGDGFNNLLSFGLEVRGEKLALISSSVIILGLVFMLLRKQPVLNQDLSPKSPTGNDKPSNGFFLSRCVFIPSEEIHLDIPEDCETYLDGKPLNSPNLSGLGLGRHTIEACGNSVDFWVLPAKEAVVKLYELHFLPFAGSRVSIHNKTPYEIANSLLSGGLSSSVSAVADVFTVSRYSLRPVGEADFHKIVASMESLGVFE